MSKNRTVEAQNRASTMRAPEPLTMEQLRGMRGKWVWISAPDSPMAPVEVCGWAYVGERHVFSYQEYENDLVVRVSYNLCDYGAWVAYAYPPDYSSKDAKMVPLTLQQLEELEEPTPVWWGVMGEWCLARRGMITAPSGRIHDVIELSGLFYARKPPTIDLEEWTTHWVERERHAGGFHEETGRIVQAPGILSEEKATVLVDGRHTYKGLYCAKCGAAAADTFLDICPRCGRAATKEGLAMLERRLRG